MSKLHIVSILDRSGSMGGTEKEVIGAYNAFVKEQIAITEKAGVEATMTLVLFDHIYERPYFKVPAHSVQELTSKEYFVRGMTALYDAIGKTIVDFEGKKKVIFFIETDGWENASVEFKGSKLKELIEKKTAEGWDFNFVGAALSFQDTAAMGGAMGIDASKTMSFDKSAVGYNARNTAFANATMLYSETV